MSKNELYLDLEMLFSKKKFMDYIQYFNQEQDNFVHINTLTDEQKSTILNWLSISCNQAPPPYAVSMVF